MSRTDDLFDHKLRNETLVRIADAAERIAAAMQINRKKFLDDLGISKKSDNEKTQRNMVKAESPWRD